MVWVGVWVVRGREAGACRGIGKGFTFDV